MAAMKYRYIETFLPCPFSSHPPISSSHDI